jgi:hypothetical protein
VGPRAEGRVCGGDCAGSYRLQLEFYRAEPRRNARDWLRAGCEVLAGLPADKALLNEHNLVWRAPISADAAQQLLSFWRTKNADRTLTHDFTDDALDTRFLGDLYQDLSDVAKKKVALLQTPVFVKEFILDRTLTPAITEFGIEGLRLIEPPVELSHRATAALERVRAERAADVDPDGTVVQQHGDTCLWWTLVGTKACRHDQVLSASRCRAATSRSCALSDPPSPTGRRSPPLMRQRSRN